MKKTINRQSRSCGPFFLSAMALAAQCVFAIEPGDASLASEKKRQVADVQLADVQVADVQVADMQMASQFNQHFLAASGVETADLSMFAYGGDRVVPGIYMADVQVNGTPLEQVEIRFEGGDKRTTGALACVTNVMLNRWGIDMTQFLNIANAAEDTCFNLPDIVPGSTIKFNVSRQQLDVNVPQVFMRRLARGYVPPEQWNAGVTAAIINYQLYGSRNETKNTSGGTNVNNSFSGGLQSGLNLGDWRIRQRSNYSRSNGQGNWQSLETYAERDLKNWRSRLTVGDGFTPGDIFEGLGIRGVQLSSDESMLPDSLRGYAPTVRGVAQTNAKVTIKQNGYVIYTTFVAPGPFVIDDLYPTSSSGTLEMVITEADGREIKTFQPYSALPTQLREGLWKYHVAAGQYRSYSGGKRPSVLQGTVARGITSVATLYGGVQAVDIYQSALAGVGTGLGDFGTASVDVTHARSKDPTGTIWQGQSARFLYAKSNLPTNTNFRILGYRYSTEHFRTLSETVRLYDYPTWQSQLRRRSRVEGNITQGIGTGSVTATVGIESYWNGGNNQFSQLGYSNNYKKLSYNVFYSYNNNNSAGVSTPSRNLSLTLTIPLDWTSTNRPMFINYTALSDLNGNFTQNAGTSGLLLSDNTLSYSANLGKSNTGGTNGSLGLSYRSPYANLGVTRSQGRGYASTTASLSGGVLVHRGGITLSQYLGDTIVLVSVPGAKGVALENNPGVKTNYAGFAVMPNATPYRLNRVALNTEDLGDDVEVKNAALSVVPSKGAVVLAQYETRKGYKALLTLRNREGKPLPFGARVEDSRGREAGIVGMDGQVYVTGADANGELVVKWGNTRSAGCHANYTLTPPPAVPDGQGKAVRSSLITGEATCI